MLILTVLVGYILLVMILQLLRRRSAQEMELQKKEQERKYQTQLEKQNRKLEIALQHEGAANRAKREFLFNMSHDIRTPMNAIIGFTSLAATHIDNREQVLDYLKKISTSSQHLLSLINDVLDMSRIESGKVKIEEKAVHLPDLVHDVRSIIQPNVSAKRLSLLLIPWMWRTRISSRPAAAEPDPAEHFVQCHQVHSHRRYDQHSHC